MYKLSDVKNHLLLFSIVHTSHHSTQTQRLQSSQLPIILGRNIPILYKHFQSIKRERKKKHERSKLHIMKPT